MDYRAKKMLRLLVPFVIVAIISQVILNITDDRDIKFASQMSLGVVIVGMSVWFWRKSVFIEKMVKASHGFIEVPGNLLYMRHMFMVVTSCLIAMYVLKYLEIESYGFPMIVITGYLISGFIMGYFGIPRQK